MSGPTCGDRESSMFVFSLSEKEFGFSLVPSQTVLNKFTKFTKNIDIYDIKRVSLDLLLNIFIKYNFIAYLFFLL